MRRSFSSRVCFWPSACFLPGIPTGILTGILVVLTTVAVPTIPARTYASSSKYVESTLSVKPLQFNRSLPHSFYDQATVSIPEIYPEHVYLTRLRYAQMEDFQYSLVAYLKEANAKFAVVEGVVVLGTSAWKFQCELPPAMLTDNLSRILAMVSEKIH